MFRKGLLWAELCALFVALPLLYYFQIIRVPKIPLLVGLALVALGILWKTPDYNRQSLFHGLRGYEKFIKPILIRSALLFTLSVLIIVLVDARLLFQFPRNQPLVWAAVMLLYPLLSAYPQEVLYRAYFFQRYQKILPNEYSLLLVNAAAFSLLHIVFDNAVAITLTLPASLLFASSYVRSGSLLIPSIEHALYGCIIFTTGLGRFFYNPS